MSRLPVRVVLAAGLLVGLATRAAPQTACTSPLDPACNHLKCYQISDKPSTVVHVDKTPVVQIDNQFGREVLYRLQPVLLCVPSKKSCCCPGTSSCPAGATGCSAANCQPNPVNAPGLPHFKCYKVKAKTCPTPDCATAKPVNFPKGTAVNLRDQFGQELNVPVGKPVILCAPVEKVVVGQTTTTTVTTTTTTVTTTTTTTTTTIRYCQQTTDCTGPCPPTQIAMPGRNAPAVACVITYRTT